MQFLFQTTSEGVLERSFIVGNVPGVLWSPHAAGAGPASLVLMGHPGGLRRKAPGLVAHAASSGDRVRPARRGDRFPGAR